MGMFDWVNYKMNCPVCGKEVDGFQSKDKDCIMTILEVGEISNFYKGCDICRTWIEFNLDKDKITIDNYKMSIKIREQNTEGDDSIDIRS